MVTTGEQWEVRGIGRVEGDLCDTPRGLRGPSIPQCRPDLREDDLPGEELKREPAGGAFFFFSLVPPLLSI